MASNQRYTQDDSINPVYLSGSGILIFNSAGDCIDANPTMSQISGFTLDELLTKKLDTLLSISNPHFQQEKPNTSIQNLQEPLTSCRVNFIDKDGQSKEYQIERAHLSNGTRIVIVPDHESLKQSQTLFDTIQTPIAVINSSEEIIIWNRSAEKHFGYSGDEIIGTSIQKIIPNGFGSLQIDDTKSSAHQPLQNHGTTIEVIGIKKTMDEIPLELSIAPWGNSSKALVTIVMQDISERQQLKEQLRQSHKMEAIGTLAGGIAHDFNNILTVIHGYSDILKDKLFHDKSALEDLEQIKNAGERAKELVKQVLSFSRKSEQQYSTIQLSSLIKQTLKLLRATIPTTIEIQTNIDAFCGNIVADPTQIYQVIVNLCSNATDAMEDKGGTMTINLNAVTLSGSDIPQGENAIQPGEFICLEISDTGKGISDHIAGKIFEPYFTTKNIDKGTGLGLAVVKEIVTAHGGFIQLNKLKDHGTTFSLYFPKVSLPSIKKMDVGELCPGGNETILVVDDEKGITDFMENMLSDLGYTVISQNSSLNALQIFRINPNYFDLVITDLTMPKMNGEEFASEIHAIRPDIPILLWSGKLINSKKEIHKIGVKSFLMKPISKIDCTRIIRQTLDGN